METPHLLIMDNGIQIWVDHSGLLRINLIGNQISATGAAASGRGLINIAKQPPTEGVVLTGPMLFKAIQELNRGT